MSQASPKGLLSSPAEPGPQLQWPYFYGDHCGSHAPSSGLPHMLPPIFPHLTRKEKAAPRDQMLPKATSW